MSARSWACFRWGTVGRRKLADAGIVTEKKRAFPYENELVKDMQAPTHEIPGLTELGDDQLLQLENELVAQMRRPEKQAEAGLKDLAHALRCVALVQAMRIKLQMEKTGEGRTIGIEELEQKLAEEAS
jgi:hypothetical protein